MLHLAIAGEFKWVGHKPPTKQQHRERPSILIARGCAAFSAQEAILGSVKNRTRKEWGDHHINDPHVWQSKWIWEEKEGRARLCNKWEWDAAWDQDLKDLIEDRG
jgi:hypothetical protein